MDEMRLEQEQEQEQPSSLPTPGESEQPPPRDTEEEEQEEEEFWHEIWDMGNDGEDRISHLPESVISHILSDLTAQEAVQTSVLSKDWEYKWTCIYNIDIDDRWPYSRGENSKTSFGDFVERILLLTQNIKEFRLYCWKKYDLSSSRIATWISTVLRRNLESLELRYGYGARMVLPRGLLNNSSLRKLKLDLPWIFKVHSKNYFPNFTSLDLRNVEIQNEVSNKDTLTLTFPLLESCALSFCKWMNVMLVEIFAPSLTSFSCETDEYYVEIPDYSIKILGPKLVNFTSSGGSAENFIMTRPPVVKAVLHHREYNEDIELLGVYGLQFRRLLKEFLSLEELEITDWVAQAIANTKQGPALPMYYKLRKMYLNLGTIPEALLEILHSAPSLTILLLDVCYNPDYDFDFDAVESVPSCILSHLEEVYFYFYSDAGKLATFLLKNGIKLRRFYISVDKKILKDEIMKECYIPAAVTSFSEMNFSTSTLINNIKRCGYVNPTPIQRNAIPVALASRDLVACAHTGSGKTAAFCFPIINGILLEKSRLNNSGYDYRSAVDVVLPVALILAPTRELSCQIHEEARKFAYQTGVRVAVAYGGAPIIPQLRILEKGVDILVATTGRLVDMIERTKVSLRNVKYLALDEVDRMLDMGFERQVRNIVERLEMPPTGKRQTMLFSATFPDQIQRLASDFLSNYVFLAAGKVGASTDLIVQEVEFVNDMDKREHLVRLLRTQKMNSTSAKGALTFVFVETKRGADALERWLIRKGFPSTAIHGDKIQMERERALHSFRSGHTPILVATDVAARGLDIPNVAHVINFDLPRAVDDYVHRIGRTGRAGNSGLATAFFSEKNAPLAKALIELMKEANQEVPTWLNEYANTSYNGGGSGRSSYSRASEYGGHDYRFSSYANGSNDEYLSQCAEKALFIDSSTVASEYGQPYATATDPAAYTADISAPITDSYASGSYSSGNNYKTIVATGWD